jgi:iron-sulfur cluster insertion protein
MTQPFIVSETAAARIAHLLATEPTGTRLRVAVEGGGCSGFQYKYDFEAAPQGVLEEDHVFGSEHAPVIVDSTSLEFLAGSMLDYVENLGAASFEIKNPNAKSGCGCGNSFSVAL